MFDIPSNEEITKVIINKDTIENKTPEVISTEGQKRLPIKSKKNKNRKGIETA
jgi:ATP-dependent Clp protease ATP-binding subunit ClpX